MFIIILICRCFASLVIYSPDEAIATIYSTSIGKFNYGKPSFYPTVGKLVFVTISSCQVNESLDGSSFAVISYADRENCKSQDLSLSVQNRNGIGAIFINHNDDVGYVWILLNTEGADQVYIFTIMISNTLGDTLKLYSDKEIWAIYEYEIDSGSSPILIYYLTGNYSKENEFFTGLQNLNNKDPISRSFFKVGLFYIFSEAPDIQVSQDCLDYYCMLSENNVTGSEKLLNTAIALNFYQELSTVTEVINFFKEVYSECPMNYSQSCISKVVEDYGGTPDNSTSVFDLNSPADYEDYIVFSIGKNWLFWPEFLELGYCLSQKNPSENCPRCTEECSYNDLQDSFCTIGCNTSNCGLTI